MIQKIINEQMEKYKGFSLNYKLISPKKGYMVSLEGHEKVFDSFNDVTPTDISYYFNKLKRSKLDLYVGGWIDSETGKFHLDISENVEYFINAKLLGNLRKQIAIWDVIHQEEIRLY